MKILGLKKEVVKTEIEIDDDEIKRIAKTYIIKKAELPNGYDWFVINIVNQLVGVIDYGGHGSGHQEKTIIRVATELDKAALLFL